ncbi:MAG TPA: DUF2849 domain-containing protein [Beijerinckiaceae bacterium]|nr:DUF2849 domain-containing protein [Beijerinckiaceae bacterium]
MPQVLTANRLRDGAVVFLGAEDRWVERLDEARVLEDKVVADTALEGAKADEKANLVLDLYAFEVVRFNGGVRATHLRDAIRAAGPSVRLDHGKQASRP